MKTKLLIGFAALQVAALAYMAAERESVPSANKSCVP